MKKTTFIPLTFSVILLATATFFSSCTQEESYTKATVETSLVASISEATATCLGIVSSDGGSTITNRGFCWSTLPLPTIENDTIQVANGTAEFTGTLKGLAPATRYYVRAFAINQGGVAYGVNVLFTTKTFSVATDPISVLMLTATSAVGGGSIVSDGDSSLLTVRERGICWNTYPTPTIENKKTMDGKGGGRFISKMDSLNAFTTYYVRAYATNDNGTIYGDEVSFTTLSGIAGLTTNPLTAITAYAAFGSGRLSIDGGAPITEQGLCWNSSPNPTTDFSKVISTASNDTISGNLTGLTPGTTYYVRTYAVNSVGTSYGDEVSFTTKDGKMDITTNSSSGTTAYATTSGGTITSDGGAPVTERGICWSTNQSPTTASNKISCASGLGTFVATITGLTPGTSYFIRSYGINSVGTTYGNQTGVITLNGTVLLTTNSVLSITANSGSCIGTVSYDGGIIVTERGLCWSNNPNPTTADTKKTNGSGTGSYTTSLTNLVSGTTYYVRAYAINAMGTFYGSQVTFTTKTGIVDLTTTAPTAIATSTAQCGGTILSNGGSTITSSGICWSTSENPTTANNKTTNGTATGAFTSSMSGLSPNTTYYVRAWATNSYGTYYGNQATFTTLSTTGTLTDIDGNVYHYVTIGTQTWMLENLKTTKYRDGTAIPNVTNGTQWNSLTTGAYCNYANDENNGNTYGRLYNWNAVINSRNIAPEGWHVPTLNEMQTLVEFARSDGGKLKEVGTTHWNSPNTSATDSLGFKALPGGSRIADGGFYNIGNDGRWWTTTENTADLAWQLNLYYGNSFTFFGETSKRYGLSVRCLRD